MECAYLKHGLAFGYSQSVKPCCEFKTDTQWQERNKLDTLDLSKWHKSYDIENLKNILRKNEYPHNCSHCKNIEEIGIANSLRQNGNLSYQDLQNEDITLEIRPGVTCNFSCQTCWPNASSRVMQHYLQANLLNKEIKNHKIDNFEFLDQIKTRVKRVIVLGGEPFYDKNCIEFFKYAQKNLKADLIIFTNGSKVNYEFIKNYEGNLNLVFSIDAIGKISEYIRYGSEWNQVSLHYENCILNPKLKTTVNLTISVYNINYLKDTIEYFLEKNNYYITFGFVQENHFKTSIIPLELRKPIIESLKLIIKKLLDAKITKDQKIHSLHTLKHLLHILENDIWEKENLIQWQQFVKKMDNIKNIKIENYSSFLTTLLNYQTN